MKETAMCGWICQDENRRPWGLRPRFIGEGRIWHDGERGRGNPVETMAVALNLPAQDFERAWGTAYLAQEQGLAILWAMVAVVSWMARLPAVWMPCCCNQTTKIRKMLSD
jgi:hypothetical protein